MTNVKKKQKLRNNEYYNLQETFDQLYAKSKKKLHIYQTNGFNYITRKYTTSL